MQKKTEGNMNMIGSWAFLIGVILVVVFGLFVGSISTKMTYLIIALGILVGLLNVTSQEVRPFLTAGTVLVIVSSLGENVIESLPLFQRVLQYLTILFVPATIIVALKSVFSMARA